MVRKIILAFLVLTILILSGCGESSITGGAVVCNKPYILVGNDCCLDKNDNNVCDKDEEDVAAEQVEPPKGEIIEEQIEEVKEEIVEEVVEQNNGEYVMKEGETITFQAKDIMLDKIDYFQNKLEVTLNVDGTVRQIYDTKNIEIINGLKVQVLEYEQLKNSVTLKVEKFELGPNEYLVDTRKDLSLIGKPEISITDILDDGAITFNVQKENELDSNLRLDEGEFITVQGITITNIEGFPRTTSGVKAEKYAIIKVE